MEDFQVDRKYRILQLQHQNLWTVSEEKAAIAQYNERYFISILFNNSSSVRFTQINSKKYAQDSGAITASVNYMALKHGIEINK